MSNNDVVKRRVVLGGDDNNNNNNSTATIDHGYNHYGYYPGDYHHSVHDQTTTYTDSDGNTRLVVNRKTAVASGGSYWDDGMLFLGIFFFFFLFILLLAAFAGSGSTYHPYYHATKQHPDSTPLTLVGGKSRGKDQCTVGERFTEAYKQCLPRESFPSAVDRTIQDTATAPCDNFEKYSCGKWAADSAHEGESRSFTYIDRKNQFDVRSIILDPKVRPVHAFYRSCVETLVEGKHQKQTKAEMRYEMHRIRGGFKGAGDLPETFGRLMRNAYTAPVALQIENHPLKPKMVPMLRFDGFPANMDNETVIDLFMANTKTRYEARGKLEILRGALAVLEKHRPKEIGDYIGYSKGEGLKNDMMMWGDFKAMAFGGNFQWDLLLQRLDGHQLRFSDYQEVWVIGRKHFAETKLDALTHHQWRVYIEFSVLYHTEAFFPDLPSNVFYRQAHPLVQRHRFTKMERVTPARRTLGSPKLPGTGVTRADCVRATQFLLPGLVSREFLSRGFHDPAAVQRVKRVVEAARDELAQMQMETPYIAEATRHAIANKTRAITVRVAHPNRWTVEPFAATITSDRYLRNLDHIREYRVQRDLELWKAGGVLDRDEAARFQGPLSTVNAWYSPTFNVITIYPGIMRYPFFHPKFDDASVYAGIGMVAGHELGHNGDSNGVFFDENGSVRDLWDVESEKQLRKHFECLVDEYANTPPASCPVKGYGKQVLGEAAADRTGIEVAFRAWQKTLPTKRATPDQAKLFFESYAQTWCSAYSEKQKCDRAKKDVHPLAPARVVNTARNYHEFQRAFNCKPRSSMVHKPACVIYGPDAKKI